MRTHTPTGDWLRRLTAAGVLAIYAALALFGESVVLCAEADGHVGVEWRGAACCSKDAPRSDAGGPANAPSALPADPRPDCVECSDTPASHLLTSVASQRVAGPKAPSPAQLPVVLHDAFRAPQWPPCSASALGERCRAPIPPPPLLALRSVVLRC